jgi:hypothetical protein
MAGDDPDILILLRARATIMPSTASSSQFVVRYLEARGEISFPLT